MTSMFANQWFTKSVLLVALCFLGLGCAKTTRLPATQIVVAITSDLMPGKELQRVEVTVSKPGVADGGVSGQLEATVVADSPKAGQRTLPLTFSITPGGSPTVEVRVVGFGVVGTEPSEREVIEQRAIVTFKSGETLLVEMFLGRICLDKVCGDATTQVCYPTAVAEVAAGDCGAVADLSKAQTKKVDGNAVPGVLGHLGHDAGVNASGVDASSTGSADAGLDSGGAAGSGGTGGAGSAGNGGTGGGAVTSDPCTTNNGGCGSASYWTCTNNAGVAPTCTDINECSGGAAAACGTGATGCSNTAGSYSCTCGTGYNGTGTKACTAVGAAGAGGAGGSGGAAGTGGTTGGDACATNNGGCGSATSWTCTNNAGAAPTCTDINECTGLNLCTADDPCVNLSGCYSCRGQFADWVPADSPATFTVNANGTVSDSRSGLVWQRTLPTGYRGCSGTSSVAGDTCTWAEAKTYCAGLSLGTAWRLPTKAELESIVDFSHSYPAIDPTAFPSTPSDGFWSSSPVADSSGNAGAVNFGIGYSGSDGAASTYRVRCVR